MTPPPNLVRALTAYDPDLRIRWGLRTSLWIIEKKADARVGQLLKSAPNPYHSAKGHDLYEGWKDGYDHVLNVHPSLVTDVGLVMEHVNAADIWREGGRAAMNRRLDELAEREAAEVDRDIANYSESAARDAYDRAAWLDGRRVSLAEPPPREHVEQRDGYLVRERRVGA